MSRIFEGGTGRRTGPLLLGCHDTRHRQDHSDPTGRLSSRAIP